MIQIIKVNKHRQSKESSSYNFWQDIFAYGEKMPNYHIGRLTMDCILAERFQKFVHIENFVNSVYKGTLCIKSFLVEVRFQFELNRFEKLIIKHSKRLWEQWAPRCCQFITTFSAAK